MAVLTVFYVIIISMYYFDNLQHHFPHIHAKCQDTEAVIRIPDGEIMKEIFLKERTSSFRHGWKFRYRPLSKYVFGFNHFVICNS